MISVRHSQELATHLRSFDVDGSTVESSLFEGGRLSYPERRRLEYELGFVESYLFEHEARVLIGMPTQWNAACRFLARLATRRTSDIDPTLDLLWVSHDAFAHLSREAGPPALDRLIAALVTVHDAMGIRSSPGQPVCTMVRACEIVVRGLQSEGFPPSGLALEEICDGAVPACVGLGIVDIDWKRERT